VRSARIPAVALALCAMAAAGCGLGPGKDEGDVTMTLTRDYGRNVVSQRSESIHDSDTVLRVLDRSADITTRYGGGFVQSIDGVSGGQTGGRSTDWFFYVNGIESSVGAAQYDLSGGDRVWWDYRDWTAAMRVPAVVGSWPEPFVHGFQGRRWAAEVECEGSAPACNEVGNRLRDAGATAPDSGGTAGTVHVVVGPWNQVRRDPVARLLASGPDRSGVFARFVGGRRALLDLLDERGEIAGTIGKGGGLIAALRPGDGPPTWVVTGTDRRGMEAAAALVGDQLRNLYAVAVQPGSGPIGVPVP
jgi:uncharacterized protein DUF4430